jgi:WD40 repeat protein
VRVWSADGTGEPLVFRGHDAAVSSAAWSPDGRRIVSASYDNTVRVWNADGTGEPLVIEGHEGVTAVRGDRPFSPDGTRIVSSSDDGTARVWNADGTGEPLVFRISDAAVNSASWSPDGKRILAASDDSTVIVWSDLDPIEGAGDPKLWTATTYCMPVDVRQRLLHFSEAQASADLARCQLRVREAQLLSSAPGR